MEKAWIEKKSEQGKGSHLLLNQEVVEVPHIRCHGAPYWLEGEVGIAAEAPAMSESVGLGSLEATATPAAY